MLGVLSCKNSTPLHPALASSACTRQLHTSGGLLVWSRQLGARRRVWEAVVGKATLWLLGCCGGAALARGTNGRLLITVRGFRAVLPPRRLGHLKFLKIPHLLG